MTTLVMLGILLFGLMAFRNLPVSDLPNVDLPTVMVTAVMPGASPETMASSVATPLERQFTTIAGIESMSSTSALGSTQIVVQFKMSRNIDAAAQDIQAAISQASYLLPKNMPSPPTYMKVNPALQPILYIALTSNTMPTYKLNEYADTLMAQRISMVDGVAQVMVFGSQKYAVRIQVDPDALASRGVGIDEVAGAVTQGNSNIPTGVLYGRYQTTTVESTGQLNDAASYRPVIVSYRKGSPVRLDEVARVTDSVEQNKITAWYTTPTVQEQSIILAVRRQPGTNTVAVADGVKTLLPTFKSQLPESVAMHIIFDNTISIRESVRDVEFTMFLTLGLVVMVIFLFLRNLSATVIPSLALPMSLIGTFAGMYLLNYSIDNLSMMALTLSVGFVVDDAIVMLENIVRHMEMGKPRMQAAFEGAREIGFTIVSMTISLAAVFIPILFMGGLVGKLFREFAVTIGMAVLISGAVSLTLTPMLCSRWLKPSAQAHHGWFYAVSEKAFQGLLSFYRWSLTIVLRHRVLTMLLMLAVLAATGFLFSKSPKGFLPSEDRDVLFGQTEAVEGIGFDSMMAHQQAVNETLRNHEGVHSFISVTGTIPGFLNSNNGFFFVHLTPKKQRTMSADDIVESLRGQFSEIPGLRVYASNPPVLEMSGRHAKSQYQYTLQSPNMEELYQYAGILLDKVRGTEGFVDVGTDLLIKDPQVTVDIDRDKASAYGLTAQQIEDSLYFAYGSRQISTILAPNNQYHVIMEVEPKYQTHAELLSLLYIRSAKMNSQGQPEMVPLSAVAAFRKGVGALTVNHQGQLPAVTLSFNLARNMPLDKALRIIEGYAKDILPPTVNTSLQGTAEAFKSSMAGMGLLFIMAVMVIYLVLGILYESFIHPLTILSALPFAAFGAVATLMLFKTELSLYAYIGIVMLVGLVKKNGIMMVDFAIEAQRQGKSPRDAIFEACMIRFRPITMTTMAALMGTLPIAMGFGAGAESRQPLGLAVVGGLIFSQSLTLFVTPVFYLYMDKFQSLFRRRRKTLGEGQQPII
jgi:hydrophobic/amphiphilic exporter-1 (mainly G- bacteria), HAE1 family